MVLLLSLRELFSYSSTFSAVLTVLSGLSVVVTAVGLLSYLVVPVFALPMDIICVVLVAALLDSVSIFTSNSTPLANKSTSWQVAQQYPRDLGYSAGGRDW